MWKYTLHKKVQWSQYRHNIVYFSLCPNVICNEIYVQETDRRAHKHITDNNKRDKVCTY